MKFSPSLIALTIASACIAAPAFAYGHGPSGMFKKFDKNGDGTITLAEARSVAAERFQAMDKNKDNVVTKPEARTHKQQMLERNLPTQASVAARIAKEDKNKNGKLERSESRLPSKWFESADTNHDASLSVSELKTAMESHKKEKGAKNLDRRVEQMFERMDKNKDGKIAKTEALSQAENRFSKMDKNKDKKVTRDELKQTKKGHRARPRDGHIVECERGQTETPSAPQSQQGSSSKKNEKGKSNVASSKAKRPAQK